MLNYIWGFMILVGILYGSITGNISEVGNGILDSGKEAISLCITMLGVMALWMGIMEIAEQTGLIRAATQKIKPLLRGLFPNLPVDHKAWDYICTNVIANVLGLGWAATPAGLRAMQELKKLSQNDNVASDEMCTFLVLNISSLQLIPVNVIAYRSQYGSVNPAVVVAPAIIATSISTIAGIIFCLIKNKRSESGEK